MADIPELITMFKIVSELPEDRIEPATVQELAVDQDWGSLSENELVNPIIDGMSKIHDDRDLAKMFVQFLIQLWQLQKSCKLNKEKPV